MHNLHRQAYHKIHLIKGYIFNSLTLSIFIKVHPEISISPCVQHQSTSCNFTECILNLNFVKAYRNGKFNQNLLNHNSNTACIQTSQC
jgi:hypothetical protein